VRVWGRSPQRYPGAEGGPPEAEEFSALIRQRNLANLPPCKVFCKLLKHPFGKGVYVAIAVIGASQLQGQDRGPGGYRAATYKVKLLAEYCVHKR